MKTLKKLILLCLCVTFAFTLCACGCDGGSTTDDGGNTTKIYGHDLTHCWEVDENGVEISEKSLHNLENGVCKTCAFTDLQTAIENTKKATKFFESNFMVNMVDYATGEDNPGFWAYKCTKNQIYESYVIEDQGVKTEKIHYVIKNSEENYSLYEKLIYSDDEGSWKVMTDQDHEYEEFLYMFQMKSFYNMVEMGYSFIGSFEIEEYRDNVYKMKAPAELGEPGWNRFEITVKDGLVIKTICYLYEFEFSFSDAVIEIPDLVS